MRVLEIAVQPDIASITGYYDKLKLYKSATYDGTYAEVTPATSLVSGQTVYPIVDNAGVASDFYRFSYYKSTPTTAESGQLDLPVYYCSIASLKSRLNETGTSDDSNFVDAVAGATGAVKRYCNRQFGQVTETRYFEGPSFKGQYTGRAPQILYVDDLLSVSELKADYTGGLAGASLTTLTINTDVYLWPQNVASQGEPYTGLAFVPMANFQVQAIQPGTYRDFASGLYWPRGYQAVRVTGTWGWPVNPITQSPIPPDVREACLQIAARIYKGRDNAYSRAVGNGDLGTLKIADDLINGSTRALLETYRRKHPNY
jgi:hypothetical protein